VIYTTSLFRLTEQSTFFVNSRLEIMLERQLRGCSRIYYFISCCFLQ